MRVTVALRGGHIWHRVLRRAGPVTLETKGVLDGSDILQLWRCRVTPKLAAAGMASTAEALTLVTALQDGWFMATDGFDGNAGGGNSDNGVVTTLGNKMATLFAGGSHSNHVAQSCDDNRATTTESTETAKTSTTKTL